MAQIKDGLSELAAFFRGYNAGVRAAQHDALKWLRVVNPVHVIETSDLEYPQGHPLHGGVVQEHFDTADEYARFVGIRVHCWCEKIPCDVPHIGPHLEWCDVHENAEDISE